MTQGWQQRKVPNLGQCGQEIGSRSGIISMFVKRRDVKENPAPPGVKCLLIVNNVVLNLACDGRVFGGIQALASDMPVTCGIPNPGTCTHMEGCLWLRVSLSPDLPRTIFM